MNVRQNAHEICHTLCATIQDLCVYAKTEIVRTSTYKTLANPQHHVVLQTYTILAHPLRNFETKTTHQSAADIKRRQRGIVSKKNLASRPRTLICTRRCLCVQYVCVCFQYKN